MRKKHWIFKTTNRAWVKRRLNSLYMVSWDRFVCCEDCVTFYGWIARPKDKYKDFLCLYFFKDGSLDFDTSSAACSLDIHEIITGTRDGHVDCKKISSDFRGINKALYL